MLAAWQRQGGRPASSPVSVHQLSENPAARPAGGIPCPPRAVPYRSRPVFCPAKGIPRGEHSGISGERIVVALSCAIPHPPAPAPPGERAVPPGECDRKPGERDLQSL